MSTRNNKMRWFHKEVLKLWRNDDYWDRKSLHEMEVLLDWKGLQVVSANLFYIVDQIAGVRRLDENRGDFMPVYLERVSVGKELRYRPNRSGRRWLYYREWLFKLIDGYHAVFGRKIPKTLGEGGR